MKRSPLAIIFLTLFVDMIGFGIVIPILPYYAEQYGARPAMIGVLLSIFSLMQFLMAPVWGRLSDRVGRRPVLLTALTATGLSYVVFGLAQSLPWLFIARGLAGAAGGSISTAQAYVADVTPPKDRAKGMGFVGAALGLGMIFGPFLGGVLSGEAPRVGHWVGGSLGEAIANRPMALPMFFAGGLCLLNVIAAAIRLPESLTPELRLEAAKNRQARLPALMKALARPQFGALIGIYFLATTGFAMMESIFALLMQLRMNMNATNIGWMFAFIGIVALPIQAGLMGRLSRTFGEWRLLPTGLGLLALGFIGVTGVTEWTGILLAAATIAIGNALAQPSTMALISRTAAAHEQGGTMGVTQSAGAMARILGPSVAGTLFGLYFAFPLYCAAALMMSALVLAVTTAARLPAPEAEKTVG